MTQQALPSIYITPFVQQKYGFIIENLIQFLELTIKWYNFDFSHINRNIEYINILF